MSGDHPPPRRVFVSHTAELLKFPRAQSFVAAAEAAIARAETRSTAWRLFVDLDEGRLQRLPVFADGTLQARSANVVVWDVGTYLPEPLLLVAWASLGP